MKLFNFNKWPVTLVVYNERAYGGFNVEIDKVRRLTKRSGEEEWRRRKNNQLIPPIFYKDLANNNVVTLFADRTGNYGRMDVNVTSGTIKGINTDVTNWAIYQQIKRRRQFENPSFFAKYGHFIATAAVLISVGVMIYISLDKIIELNAVGANALTHLKDIMEQNCRI